MPRSLYIHIPFCPGICPYCDFHKMRRQEGLVGAFLDRLEDEARDLSTHFPDTLDTIYLGGGTPSHLTDEELTRLVQVLRQTWGFPAALETTLEADPLTFDTKRLELFKALGFSRLSIGLQSTQDEVLKFLGRLHNGREGLHALEMALAAGLEVSADLITAVTGQDTARDLHALAQTGVKHVSVYNLTIEPNTPFGRRGVQVDEDKEADDYLLTNEVLQGYGLERYEVSSHAVPGHEAVHNQVYWHGDYFLALGPSAAGFIPSETGFGLRTINPPIKAWLEGQRPEVLELGAVAYVQDVLSSALRTRRGVDLGVLEARTGLRVLERYKTPLEALEKAGLLARHKTRLLATDAGLIRLNRVLEILTGL